MRFETPSGRFTGATPTCRGNRLARRAGHAPFASRSTNGWWKVTAQPVDNTSWRNMRIANYVLTKDETRYGDDPAACH